MAPTVYWEEFEKENLKSDLLYEKLYPGDCAKKSRYKDSLGENDILGVYHNWLKEISNDDNIDPARRKFYKHLKREVRDDFREIWYELNSMNDYSILQRFEFREFDGDGGTTKLEGLLQEGEAPAFEDDPEVQAKYGYLLRGEYPPLSRFELRYIYENGTAHQNKARPGSDWRPGSQILPFYGQETRTKYAYLRDISVPKPKYDESSDCGGEEAEGQLRLKYRF